jgi:hypothetical protein
MKIINIPIIDIGKSESAILPDIPCIDFSVRIQFCWVVSKKVLSLFA